MHNMFSTIIDGKVICYRIKKTRTSICMRLYMGLCVCACARTHLFTELRYHKEAEGSTQSTPVTKVCVRMASTMCCPMG